MGKACKRLGHIWSNADKIGLLSVFMVRKLARFIADVIDKGDAENLFKAGKARRPAAPIVGI